MPPYTCAAAEEASAITARLMDIGRPVNALDVLIAGIALSNGAERLITRDRDFLEIAKISDLSVTILLRKAQGAGRKEQGLRDEEQGERRMV